MLKNQPHNTALLIELDQSGHENIYITFLKRFCLLLSWHHLCAAVPAPPSQTGTRPRGKSVQHLEKRSQSDFHSVGINLYGLEIRSIELGTFELTWGSLLMTCKNVPTSGPWIFEYLHLYSCTFMFQVVLARHVSASAWAACSFKLSECNEHWKCVWENLLVTDGCCLQKEQKEQNCYLPHNKALN